MFNRSLAVVFALSVSLGSWQIAQARVSTTQHGVTAIKNAVSSKVGALSRYALAGALSLGLLAGVGVLDSSAHGVDDGVRAEKQELIQQLHSQEASFNVSYSSSSGGVGWQEKLAEHGEEDNDLVWSEEVTQGDGVFYLALRNPNYEHIHHVVYVGDTATGEPMFAGIYLVGHEEDHITLYAPDGWVTQGFMQREIMNYPDPLGLWSEVTVFTIKDLNLAGRYTPVSLSDFPVHDKGRKLHMLQFGVNADNPEALADLPIKQRSCEVLPPNVWGKVPGVGRHSCAPLDESHGEFGAPIFDAVTSDFVGFFSETAPSGANLSEGMTPDFIQFILEQQANPTAVEARDKLTTTWGAIKSIR